MPANTRPSHSIRNSINLFVRKVAATGYFVAMAAAENAPWHRISRGSAAALIAVILVFCFVLRREVRLPSLVQQKQVMRASPLSARSARFDHGLWFDGQAFVPKTFYAVEGILHADYRGVPDTVIDLQNQFVIPPFADAHNHVLADGMDYQDQIQIHLRQGIFYVKNPNNTRRFTAPLRAFVNQPASIDVIYSNGGLTASGGHPIQIYDAIAQSGHFPGLTKADMKNEAYFVVDSEKDLEAQWPLILAGKPDFIKTYLEYSEEFDLRQHDEAYYGRKGLDPKLLPQIVAKAHAHQLRVAVHVSTAADFHHAVLAGVDEIAHLPLAQIANADAALAAQQGTVVVTTTISHRPTAHIKNLVEIHRHNLRLLHDAGVNLALGTDDNNRTVVEEAENIQRMEVFAPVVLLKIWVENTPRTIFPERKIGALQPGYEASFLVLPGNPLQDFSSIRKIYLRCKQGRLIDVRENLARATGKPSIASVLAHTLRWKDVEAALAEYYHLKQERPHDYNFAESELNNLGYNLLREHKAREAAAIFKLNAEVYPQSANVYDSLADAYVANGENAHARQCYEKVLELLPQNHHYSAELSQKLEENAREKLRSLQPLRRVPLITAESLSSQRRRVA